MSELNPMDYQPIVFMKDGHVFCNSRNVATFFGKEHKNVLRDIDVLIAAAPDLGSGPLLKFEQAPYQLEQTGNQVHRSFDMDRDGFTLLAMGFSGPRALKWKLRYIDAFNVMEAELRAKAQQPAINLNDPVALRGLLLNYSERTLQLEKQVEELLPQQEALQRIAEADGSLCITDAAKALQLRPKELFDWLRHNGWIYRRLGSGHDLGYQSKTATGLLEHKVTTVLRADGSEKVSEQVRITPRGLTKLAQLIQPALKLA